ncbi:MAG: hypothetical protein L6R40_003119 [Gallowayella cf. fulva]|nr:MAG: hypothetical protein L6R40_003119 [Xanthomendoza cf. fulva]
MKTKAIGYGRQGRQNIAVLMQQLHVSTPEKATTTKVPKYGTEERRINEDATRPPLAPVDTNAQRKKEGEKTKEKTRKPKRQSLLPDKQPPIKAVDLEHCTAKYLEPLRCLKDVNSDVLDFESWASTWSSVCGFEKIAHGAYGAVYRMESKSQPCISTIGKLIPLQARIGWGSKTKQFTPVKSAANEVFFLSTLDEIDGFVQFRKAEVLCGRLPEPLAAASTAFDDKSHDDIPTRFPQACTYPTQLWLFIEMSDAGIDLETALRVDLPREKGSILRGSPNGDKYLSAVQVRDIFWQVASAVAVAEKKLDFEHRDLHLGNICLTRSHQQVEGMDTELWTSTPSLLVTIIDYSLSRGRTADDATVFKDLSDDPELFTGQGDPQYEVYRQMRGVAEEEDDSWEGSMPFTNVLWLDHLLEMLLERATIIHQDADHCQLWQKLTDLRKSLGRRRATAKFNSAQDVVEFCEMETSR